MNLLRFFILEKIRVFVFLVFLVDSVFDLTDWREHLKMCLLSWRVRIDLNLTHIFIAWQVYT